VESLIRAARLIPEDRYSHHRLPRDPPGALVCAGMAKRINVVEQFLHWKGTDLTPLIKALATLGKQLDLAFLCSPDLCVPYRDRRDKPGDDEVVSG
jgi:hypothetical protein